MRGLIGLTLAVALAMMVLLGLGSWQLQRLNWKLGLIQHIKERVHAPPVALDALLARGPDVIAGAEYTHVTITGTFQHDLERYLYATGDDDWGWSVFTPLAQPNGPTIIINRGFVPRQLLDRAARVAGLPMGLVTISGLVRLAPGPRPWWAPNPDPSKFSWYWPEIGAIAASMVSRNSEPLAAFYVDADSSAGPVPPAGGATNLDLPNRHLEYALTWFGLAATLAVIYVVFVFRRLSGVRG